MNTLHLNNLSIGFLDLDGNLKRVNGLPPMIPKLPKSLEHLEVDHVRNKLSDKGDTTVLNILSKTNSAVFGSLKSFTVTTVERSAMADLGKILKRNNIQLSIRDSNGEAYSL